MISRFQRTYMRITLTFLLGIATLMTFAQDKGLDVDINVKKENEWYQQPWAWVIGGAVFVLLLVALLRGKSTKNE